MKSPKKRNFSSFSFDEAFKEVGIEELTDWKVDFNSLKPTSFFAKRLKRLDVFDLTRNESAKTLLIDAFLEEALQNHQTLKAWKEPILESETLNGIADYLITKRRGYLELPFLCAVEAKKDDFEQGLAQCLVEMKACKEANLKGGKDIDIFGIVTNGTTWEFYKMTNTEVFKGEPFINSDAAKLIGMLDYVFAECEKNI
jgi:hypothetical protein